MFRNPAPDPQLDVVEAALADASTEKILHLLNRLSADQVAELHGQIARLGEMLERRHTEYRDRPAGRHRKRPPASTVPEDYSFHDGSMVIRARDTGDEPLGPPADYT